MRKRERRIPRQAFSRSLQRLSYLRLLWCLLQLDFRDMLTGNHHQTNQSTGHIYLDILGVVVVVSLITGAGSNLFNGRGGRIAIFVRICEDHIPCLYWKYEGQLVFFFLKLPDGCLVFSPVCPWSRIIFGWLTYCIGTLERTYECARISRAHPQRLTDQWLEILSCLLCLHSRINVSQLTTDAKKLKTGR